VRFGSTARGTEHAESDVDLAVRAKHGALGFPELIDLTEQLAPLFGGRKVDLVDLRRADPLLLRQIFKVASPLYQEARAFEEARLYAFHRYQDYKPYLELERRAVRRALGLHAD
jgi:predicted nucleotidyltransferase